ncbi:MAG: hypothetical protein ACREQW_19105, partial [Candidatus Binatia bacterium]
MNRRTFLKQTLRVSTGLVLSGFPTAFGIRAEENQMRNSKLADIPDNTWVNLKIKVPMEAGGWE